MLAAFADAARVPIDARFIVDGDREVRGWTFNMVESYKPFGDIAACMLDGVPGGSEVEFFDVTLEKE